MSVVAKRRPKLAVWKFASCDGCQLSLLDCEDELLAIAGEIEIAYFMEATRAVVISSPDTHGNRRSERARLIIVGRHRRI